MDAYDYWKEKFKARPQLEVYISDYLQKNASPQDLENHIDIADWLIRWKQAPDTMTLPADTPIHPIQQARLELVLNELRHYWSEETVQAAAPLIEDLDLEIKSVTYIKPNEDIPIKERLCRADKLSCQIGHPIQETIINQCANEPL